MRNLSDRTDEELIALIIEQDNRQALTCLISRYRKTCRRVLYGLCSGNINLMDDAEQEIFIALKKALLKFRSESSFSTFFYRFVRNRGLDLVRKHRRRSREISVSAFKDSDGELISKIAGPEEQMLRKEELMVLWNILDSMKEEESTMIILKDIEGLSLQEISMIMNKPVGTVKSRLHRARRKAVLLGREAIK
ncbi:MAG TPA: hypothetical protein DCO79_07565 [Spirochaeta sp.]|nr:hypothetical protein [Spirochaeta sp.]